MNIKNIIAYSLLTLIFVGCSDDFLETEPAEIVSFDQASASPAATQAVINGIYAGLRSFGAGGSTQHVDYGLMSTKNGTDMMSHDVVMDAFSWFIFYMNYDGRVQTASRTRVQWNTYYSQILASNIVIPGLLDSYNAGETSQEDEHLLGQALALRALCYHYLVRMYGTAYSQDPNAPGVPMYDGGSFDGRPRSTVQEVYTQISTDMALAVTLLDGFTRSSKALIDQQVANGLLAEIYMDMENWTGAAAAANAARQGWTPMSGTEYANSGFHDISNGGWMWGAPIDNESSTIFASMFSHFDSFNAGYGGALQAYKRIDADLYSQISPTDERINAWVVPAGNGTFPGYVNTKFVDPSFFEADYVYMRAAEMYLVEAEALAKAGGNDAQAAQVLFDLISTRDANYTLSANTGTALQDEIYLHRRIELWGEGFAWFDLKRMGLPLRRDYPGSNHGAAVRFNFNPDAAEFIFQIPEDEINANDALTSADQNP